MLRAPGTATDPSLEYREILTYDIVLITPLDHPLAGRETVTLEEAARFPAVVPPAGSNSRRFGDEVVRQRGIRIPAVIEVGGWDVLKRYVASGFGVSAVPSICIHENDNVSVIPYAEQFPSWSYGVFTRRGEDLTPPAEQLLRLMIREPAGSPSSREDRGSSGT